MSSAAFVLMLTPLLLCEPEGINTKRQPRQDGCVASDTRCSNYRGSCILERLHVPGACHRCVIAAAAQHL